MSGSFIPIAVFSLFPRANKGTSHYINLIRYFIEYCEHALQLASIFFIYFGRWHRRRAGRRRGEAAPKKLCIFFPLFSHRRDETARDIDPPRVRCYKLQSRLRLSHTLDIFSAIILWILKFFIRDLFLLMPVISGRKVGKKI